MQRHHTRVQSAGIDHSIEYSPFGEKVGGRFFDREDIRKPNSDERMEKLPEYDKEETLAREAGAVQSVARANPWQQSWGGLKFCIQTTFTVIQRVHLF